MADFRDVGQQQDLLLAPGEYVYSLDTTKGTANVLVGPYQSGVSGNAKPVLWDKERFVRRERYEEVVQRFVSVSEGDYIELTNPSKDPNREHPADGTSNSLVELNFGRRVVIPGPAYFALWPRQSHRVIQGHKLRTNQYVLARVYDDAAALANWEKGVIKRAVGGKAGEEASQKPEALTTGQLLVIKGTDVSFYIPPTGIEVLPDKNGNLVRNAVTLERMEFCILLGENGEKRYVPGPDVVFPSPTETFVEMEGEVKFKPIELTPISGIHVKVIADYEENGEKHKAGEELFITGATQAIYYPRPEHNIIQYGDRQIHFATAVPKGEGRYVLDRETGDVTLVKGPTMLLPDPRKEVIVRRVLDPNQVALWYPGNTRAGEINRRLQEEVETAGLNVGEQRYAALARGGPQEFAGDALKRGTTYRSPRTITLDTKYDGAVAISPWPGFAVLVVDKSGNRRVVEGPASILLEYDETLMPTELSTGTPKTDKNTMKTVYLQVHNNRVSDRVVGLETSDLVRVDLAVAYRVNFEGNNPQKWFDVDNYVRFLTEHIRSLLRNIVKQHGIEEFYRNPIGIIRDGVLGKSEDGKRPGRFFEENAMRVYEVDVTAVEIEDDSVAKMLESAQSDALRSTLEVAAKEALLAKTRRIEAAGRKIAEEEAATREAELVLEITDIAKRLEKELASLASLAKQEEARLAANLAEQGVRDSLNQSNLARQRAAAEQEIELEKKSEDVKLATAAAETREIVARAAAVSDKFIAALQAFGDRKTVTEVAEAMAPLAIFRSSGVLDVFAGLLQGTPVAEALKRLKTS